MERLEQYAPQPPWAWKKRKLKKVVIAILIIVLLTLGYQVIKTYVLLQDIKATNENMSIYYYGEIEPPVLLKWIYRERVVITDDIFAEDTRAGDIIIIGKDVVKDYLKMNSNFIINMRDKIIDGTMLVLKSDATYPEPLLNMISIDYHESISRYYVYSPYYMFIENENIMYREFVNNSISIKSLQEANLILEILELQQ